MQETSRLIRKPVLGVIAAFFMLLVICAHVGNRMPNNNNHRSLKNVSEERKKHFVPSVTAKRESVEVSKTSEPRRLNLDEFLGPGPDPMDQCFCCNGCCGFTYFLPPPVLTLPVLYLGDVFYEDSFEHEDFGHWTPSKRDSMIRKNNSTATDGESAVLLRNQGYITTSFLTTGLQGYFVTFDFFVRNIQGELIPPGNQKGLVLEHSAVGLNGPWYEAASWLDGDGPYDNNLYQVFDFAMLPFTVGAELYLRFRMNGSEKDDHVFLDKIDVAGVTMLAATPASISEIYFDSFELGFGNWTSSDPTGDGQLRDAFATNGNWTILLRNQGYIYTSISTGGLRGYGVKCNVFVRNIEDEVDIFGKPKGLVLEHSFDGPDGPWAEVHTWLGGIDFPHTSGDYNIEYQHEFRSLQVPETLFIRLRMNGGEKNDHAFLDEVVVFGVDQ